MAFLGHIIKQIKDAVNVEITEKFKTDLGYDIGQTICTTFDANSFYGGKGKQQCMIAAESCGYKFVESYSNGLIAKMKRDKNIENPPEHLVLERSVAQKSLPQVLEEDGLITDLHYPEGGEATITVLKKDSEEVDCIKTDVFQ